MKKKSIFASFKKGVILLIAVFSFVLVAVAQKGFNPDDLLKPRTGKQTLVNDFAGILTPDQNHALENKLVALDDSTFTQIAVVIVPSIGDRNISDYNVELARAWGVGNKKTNSGVVLLIAKDDRKLDITVGYGLEGALPDITSKSIIDDIIVPNFKGNDYYRGIDEGTDAIIAAVKGEYNTPRAKHAPGMSSGKIVFIIFLIVLFLILSSRNGGGGGGGTFMSRRGARGLSGPIFWPTSGGGGWGGGGSSGGGWGGGGSSGGFGGFGGGSFGGGGSSGSW